MEVFDIVNRTDREIVLQDEKQLSSLYDLIDAGEVVLIRWTVAETEDEYAKEMSELLVTESLMSRIKDGRLVLRSRKTLVSKDYDEEDDSES